MSSLEEIRQVRLQKLQLIKDKGINPFPVSTESKITLAEAVKKFSTLSKKKSITLSGRI
ncbi:lysine--tRNA ligase, partial [Candidatus Nomurabacteria bacterium]|nr:lysine--tRNA ligase [Candidatus Nomurabacteria bacterium]